MYREGLHMCNCYSKCLESLQRQIPDAVQISGDRIVPNGRTYERFNYFERDKKRKTIIQHNYCPYCGKAYGENSNE